MTFENCIGAFHKTVKALHAARAVATGGGPAGPGPPKINAGPSKKIHVCSLAIPLAVFSLFPISKIIAKNVFIKLINNKFIRYVTFAYLISAFT